MNHPISVLLVDDDELVRTCILSWLEDEGFAVHAAADEQEALSVLARVPIDVALVDLQLGNSSGEDLIVRAFAGHPAVRFLIHTGKHFYQLPDRLLELGMQPADVVLKPIVQLEAFAALLRRRVSGAADVK
jgi:DNA-binding response OmpR family regulator